MSSPNPEIGLADSEIIGYSRSGEALEVKLRLWDESEAMLRFHGVIGLSDRGGRDVSGLVVKTGSDEPEFGRAVRRMYESEEARGEHCFCFLDNDDEPLLLVFATTCDRG